MNTENKSKKPKTLQSFKNRFARNYLESNLFDVPILNVWGFFVKSVDTDVVIYGMECAAQQYATYVGETALQGFKDEVITQINHAKENFPSHSFDPEFTRGITKGFQMASAIVNTKKTNL